MFFFFFSSRRRHTRLQGDWSSDVCSSDLEQGEVPWHLLYCATTSGVWQGISLVRECRSDAHIPEARRGCAVAGPHRLHGLALAAVGRAPERPVSELADGVAGIPEFRGDPAVTGVFQHADFLAAFDLPANFRRKLELVTAVINGPGAICFHEDAVACVRDEVAKVPGAWQQTDVCHSNDRQAIPAFRTHRAGRTI